MARRGPVRRLAAVAALLGVGTFGLPPVTAQPLPAQPSAERAGEVVVLEHEQGHEMLRYPPSSTRAWVVGSGVGLFAVAYGTGMACGFGWPEVPGADALKVPVVGPWVALGQSGCAAGEDDCTGILVVRTILTVLDGLVQLGGVGLLLEGLLMTTEADAPANEGGSSKGGTVAPGSSRPSVAPSFTSDRASVVVGWRF